MPKYTQNKLTQFIKVFQKNQDQANSESLQKEAKRAKVDEYLPSQDYHISFNDCLGLYKIVLQQDKFTDFRQKKNWHKQEVKVLVFMVIDLFYKGRLNIQRIQASIWEEISFFFSGRSADDCKFKWLSFSKHPINLSQFDPQEENLLRQLLKELDYENTRPRWKIIAIQFNNRSSKNDYIYRSSKQLKKKWVSSICNVQKGLWRKQEDLFLFESVNQYGKRWSYISKLMKEVRTQNGVKNRFFSVIQKQTQICMKKKILISQNQIIVRIIKKIKQSLSPQTNSSVAKEQTPQQEPKSIKNTKSTGQIPIEETHQKQISQNLNEIQTKKPNLQLFSIEPQQIGYYIQPYHYPLYNPIFYTSYTIPTVPVVINYGVVCQTNPVGVQGEQEKKEFNIKRDV